MYVADGVRQFIYLVDNSTTTWSKTPVLFVPAAADTGDLAAMWSGCYIRLEYRDNVPRMVSSFMRLVDMFTIEN